MDYKSEWTQESSFLNDLWKQKEDFRVEKTKSSSRNLREWFVTEECFARIRTFYDERDLASMVHLIQRTAGLFKDHTIEYYPEFAEEFDLPTLITEILADPPDSIAVSAVLDLIACLTYSDESNYADDMNNNDPPILLVLKEIFDNPDGVDEHKCKVLDCCANIIGASYDNMVKFWEIWEDKQVIVDAAEDPTMLPHVVRLLYSIIRYRPPEIYSDIATMVTSIAKHIEAIMDDSSSEAKHVLRMFLMCLVEMASDGAFIGCRQITPLLERGFFDSSDYKILCPVMYSLESIYKHVSVTDCNILKRITQLLGEEQCDDVVFIACCLLRTIFMSSEDLIADYDSGLKSLLGFRLLQASMDRTNTARMAAMDALFFFCYSCGEYTPHLLKNGFMECMLDMLDTSQPRLVHKGILLLDQCFLNYENTKEQFLELAGIDALMDHIDDEDEVMEAAKYVLAAWFPDAIEED